MPEMYDGLDKLAPGAGAAAETGRRLSERALIVGGLAGAAPALPTATAASSSITIPLHQPDDPIYMCVLSNSHAVKASWWRRLLRRFGR